MVAGPTSVCANFEYFCLMFVKLLPICEFSVCPAKSSTFFSTQSSFGSVYSNPLITNVNSPNYFVSLHLIGLVFNGILPMTFLTAQEGIVISEVPESTVIRQSGELG